MFKKIIVISLLLGSLILTGCSQKNELSKDELFEKKQECVKHKEDIEKDIAVRNFWNQVEFLEEIFYSPTENTCMYRARGKLSTTLKDWEIINKERERVYDFFTKETIIWTDNRFNDEYFYNKLKELKWE